MCRAGSAGNVTLSSSFPQGIVVALEHSLPEWFLFFPIPYVKTVHDYFFSTTRTEHILYYSCEVGAGFQNKDVR